MNKTHYRLVFNKLRGMLMAVAEHVASTGKSTQETKANGANDALTASKNVKQIIYKQKLLAGTIAALFCTGVIAAPSEVDVGANFGVVGTNGVEGDIPTISLLPALVHLIIL